MNAGDDTAGRRRAWSDYWSRGALHSCTGSFDARYSGVIGDFWDGQLDALPDDARVLDLGTGNGALPLRIWERDGGGRGWRVDAVDLASVAPDWHDADRHRTIEFHTGVEMEALPFADRTFDCVASQFGLEYARRPAAVREAVRVARPDGRLACVMHHAGSVLVEVGRAELESHAMLLARGGLLERARDLLPGIAAVRAGRDPGPSGIAARDAYNAEIARVGQAIAGARVPDALADAREHVHRLVADATPESLPRHQAAIEAYAAAIRDGSLRTREMVEHALDAAGIASIAAMVQAARPDWRVRYAPLVQPEGVLAWALSAS